MSVCTKIPFTSKAEAMKVAKHMNQRKRTPRCKNLYPYECHICGKIHLSSTTEMRDFKHGRRNRLPKS